MKEFCFDLFLKGAVRVFATDEEEARAMLDEELECATFRVDDSKLVGEVSLAGDPVRYEDD